jgi:2'-5' RNA ligase
MFKAPTYIVLDLPPPIKEWVSAVRSRFDAYQAQLPPEITVAGSSGLGVLSENQDAEFVFRAVEKVALEFLPIHTAFVSIERFPNVPIFWLKPRDRAPFDILHQALTVAGIKFCPSPFPFNPHCTISSTVEHCDERVRELLELSVPRKSFVLATLRICQLVDNRVILLSSWC